MSPLIHAQAHPPNNPDWWSSFNWSSNTGGVSVFVPKYGTGQQTKIESAVNDYNGTHPDDQMDIEWHDQVGTAAKGLSITVGAGGNDAATQPVGKGEGVGAGVSAPAGPILIGTRLFTKDPFDAAGVGRILRHEMWHAQFGVMNPAWHAWVVGAKAACEELADSVQKENCLTNVFYGESCGEAWARGKSGEDTCNICNGIFCDEIEDPAKKKACEASKNALCCESLFMTNDCIKRKMNCDLFDPPPSGAVNSFAIPTVDCGSVCNCTCTPTKKT